MMPSIKLEVYKENELIEEVQFENKSFYYLGANPKKCAYVLRHPSISRVHAGFIIDQKNGVLLVDL